MLLLMLDVVLGVVLAGFVAPLALAVLPAAVRGRALLVVVAVLCVVAVSAFRRLVLTQSRR